MLMISSFCGTMQLHGHVVCLFAPPLHPDEQVSVARLHLPTAGVVREKVGDILVLGEAGAQILVDPDLVEHFEVRMNDCSLTYKSHLSRSNLCTSQPI